MKVPGPLRTFVSHRVFSALAEPRYISRTGSIGAERGASSREPTALAAANLIVRFGDRLVLDVPSLAAYPGEILAVMGPNGAGKSTLLLCLALLQRPTSGGMCVGGEMVNWGRDLLRLRRRMAVVFQEPLLLDASVQENVAVGLRLRGLKGEEVQQRVWRWLARFGVAHLARQQARNLSGGEAQRTSLARAFALAPEILLLDEPFAALDPPTRASLLSDLKEALRDTGISTVMITHDRDEALALGDRVAVLIAGRLRQVGTPEEVFAFPVDAEVASFVGVETVAPGTVVRQEEGIADVEVGGRVVQAVSPMPVKSQVLVCLRPEDVTLFGVGDTGHASSARNSLQGVVDRVTPLGAQVRVVVDCGFPLVAMVTRRSAAELDLASGHAVSASFKASAVHLIRR